VEETTTQSPVAEAPDARPAPLSEPTGNPALRPGGQRARSLEELFSQSSQVAAGSPSVSNEGDAEPSDKAAKASDGEPPAGAGSKPAEADKAPGKEATPTAEDKPTVEKPSRRDQGREANLARIAELEQEVTRLRTETPADPAAAQQAAIDAAVAQALKAREDEQARSAADAATGAEREALHARNQRYLALRDKPLSELEAEDYQFVEAERELRAKYPDVRQIYEVQLEADRAAIWTMAEQQLQQTQEKFWNGVELDMASAKQLPGVDYDAVKAAKTFAERDAVIQTGTAAWKEAEVRAELQPQIDDWKAKFEASEAENRDLKLTGRRGLAGARAPIAGGRSASGDPPSTYDPRRSGRENLAAALAGS
jgi:hypothetical protein